MAEYHVGCGLAGIYAGTYKKNGTEWRNKSEVSNEAFCAVALYLLFNDKTFKFQYKDKWYKLEVVEDEGWNHEMPIQKTSKDFS